MRRDSVWTALIPDKILSTYIVCNSGSSYPVWELVGTNKEPIRVLLDRTVILDRALNAACHYIARASPPILLSASTCSWKWSTMISALSRIA